MSTQPTSVKIRRPVASDSEYILKTTLREHRRALPRAYPDRLYYNQFQSVILALTRKAHARVICDQHNPDFIIGYVIGEYLENANTFVVHYAYVRPPFRRMGLMRAALEDMGYPGPAHCELVATHWNDYVDRFKWASMNLIYNPDLLYTVS